MRFFIAAATTASALHVEDMAPKNAMTFDNDDALVEERLSSIVKDLPTDEEIQRDLDSMPN